MITEDYVSFETAELLKEKGMNKSCFKHYVQKNNNDGTSEAVTVCSLQMAMKWLREVHKIHITVYPYGEHSCGNYQFDIYKNREYLLSKDEGYMTNEQAIEVAIKYCLENLI